MIINPSYKQGVNYKRILLGSFLFVAYVGEVSVGLYSGLFTPPGLLVLSCLYVILFLLYEALNKKYSLTNTRVILLTFGIYSVGVTGLLHGEIANYVASPQHGLITTFIRVQCSLFAVFAYYLLNKIFPSKATDKTPSIRSMIIISMLFVLLLTPSKKFGLINTYHTFQTAPLLSVIFTMLGIICIFLALRQNTSAAKRYSSRVFTIISVELLILSLIPLLQAFIVLVFIMPIFTLWFMRQPVFRKAQV